MHKTVNQIFKEKVEFLKSEKGVSFKRIANAISIKEDKMKAIRIGKSSAKEYDLIKLYKAYPEISDENDPNTQQQNSALEAKVEKLETRLSIVEQHLLELLKKDNPSTGTASGDIETLKHQSELEMRKIAILEKKVFELLDREEGKK